MAGNPAAEENRQTGHTTNQGCRGRYETRLGRTYYWIVWYPMVYWIIQVVTSVTALPRAIFRGRGKRAIWVSPDRGVQEDGHKARGEAKSAAKGAVEGEANG